MTSWVDMTQDIGYLILDKLPEVIEHVRFGAVCKYWYAISAEYQQLSKHSRRALPMLLVPSPDAPAQPAPPKLYALSNLGHHYQNLRHSLPFSRFRFCGSSNGWLATQNKDFTITLVYPFGRELLSVKLPYLRYERGMKHDFHIRKLIVSPESTPEDYKIVVIFGDLNRVATVKSGEGSWTLLDLPDICFDDIIFFKNMVYGVNSYFAVVRVNIEVRPLCCEILHPQDFSLRYMKTHVVESSASELFVLGRIHSHTTLEGNRPQHGVADHVEDAVGEDEDMSDDEDQAEEDISSDDDEDQDEDEVPFVYNTISMTKKFNVYNLKLDERSGTVLEFMESKHLDGDTFFVGDSESMAFPARCFPGCKSDSIYFTDDLVHVRYYEPNGPEDVGCYNIEDGTINRFYTLHPFHKRNVPQPIWVAPRYHI